MSLIEMRLDGADMMVPEEDCVWTKKDGELHHIHTLGSGFSLFEFEGLEGTFEERLQQVKDNRKAATKDVVGLANWKKEKRLEEFPTITTEPEFIHDLEKIPIVPEIDNTINEHIEDFPRLVKPKKKTTSDWLFDN